MDDKIPAYSSDPDILGGTPVFVGTHVTGSGVARLPGTWSTAGGIPRRLSDG